MLLAAVLCSVLILEAALLGLWSVSLYQQAGNPWFAVGIPLSVALGWRLSMVFSTFGMSRAWRGQSFWGALRTTFGESLTTLYLYTLAQPLLALIPRLRIGGEGPVVVLVHGFVCNAGMWGPLQRHLQKRGFGRIYAVSLDPFYRSVPRSLAEFESKLSHILKREDAEQAVLIGHSMGGVLARVFRHRNCARVKACITIGAPHSGTELSRWVSRLENGPARPDMLWLKELNVLAHDDRRDEGVLNIWSRADNIVYPQSNAQLSHARDACLDGFGHLHLASAPATLNLISEFLAEHKEAS